MNHVLYFEGSAPNGFPNSRALFKALASKTIEREAQRIFDTEKKEKETPVHDVFIEEKWQDRELAGAIGFTHEVPEED